MLLHGQFFAIFFGWRLVLEVLRDQRVQWRKLQRIFIPSHQSGDVPFVIYLLPTMVSTSDDMAVDLVPV